MTHVVDYVTLVEIWCGNNPSVDHLKFFGCVAWAHILDDCRKKLDAKSHACIMMGYSEEYKYYQLFDPIKQQIIIRRNVFFDESLQELSCLMLPLVYYKVMVPLMLFLEMIHLFLSSSF